MEAESEEAESEEAGFLPRASLSPSSHKLNFAVKAGLAFLRMARRRAAYWRFRSSRGMSCVHMWLPTVPAQTCDLLACGLDMLAISSFCSLLRSVARFTFIFSCRWHSFSETRYIHEQSCNPRWASGDVRGVALLASLPNEILGRVLSLMRFGGVGESSPSSSSA